MPLKILSWNVNGLRSFKQPMIDFLNDLDADIICLQETKITRDMLTEDLAIVGGFTSYFSFSRKRSGYSGVATYVKDRCNPFHASEGLCGTLVPEIKAPTSIRKHECLGEVSAVIGATHSPLPGKWTKQTLKDIDNEGRTVITLHHFVPTDEDAGDTSLQRSDPLPLAVINVYCPRADPERADRGLYKLQFYRALRMRAALLADAGARVVVVGDLNTSHQKLDHCDPDQDFHLNPGRKFLDALLVTPRNRRDRIANCILSSSEGLGEHQKSEIFLKESSTAENSCEGEIDCTDISVTQDHIETENGKRENQQYNEDNSPTSIDDSSLDDSYDDKESESLLSVEMYRDFRMVDTFRSLYPKKKDAFSCWNMKASARSTNYGTRIDYALCDELFFGHVTDSLVLQDVMGSDHCPVACICKIEIIPAEKLPLFCSKNFAEFQGEQQNIFSYFQKVNREDRAQSDLAVNAESSVATSDSLKRNKSLESYFVQNVKDRESGCQDNSSKNFVMHQSSTHFTSSSLGEKRKNSPRSCEGIKNKQPKLSSFFTSSNAGGSSPQSTGCRTKDVTSNRPSSGQKLITHRSAPNDGDQLSLYEAELKYLRENPHVYERLNLGDDGEVNMNVFIETETRDSSDGLKTDLVSVKNSQCCTSDSSIELEGCCDGNLSVILSHSTDPTEDFRALASASKEFTYSSSDDGCASNTTTKISSSNGNLDVPRDSTPRGQINKAESESPISSNSSARSKISSDWSFLGKKVAVPLCFGHNEPAVLRTSKKKGVNFNRKFYACARGVGRPGQKDAQCNFFKWL